MCRKELGEQTVDQWKEVKQITDAHTFPSLQQARNLLPGVSDSLYNELLSRQLQFKPDYYRIVNFYEAEKLEETKEQYGFDANGVDPNRSRGST